MNIAHSVRKAILVFFATQLLNGLAIAEDGGHHGFVEPRYESEYLDAKYGFYHPYGRAKSLACANRELSDEDMAWIDPADDVEFLSLNGTRIGDAGLGKLSARRWLRCLDVSETRVSDAGLNLATDFRRLRHSC